MAEHLPEHQEHIVKPSFYVAIWAALMCLTALTAFMSTVDLEKITGLQVPLNAVVAMLIAGTKASLVALFFMHMRWSDVASRIAAIAGLFWLAIMFLLTCSDFFTRHWLVYPG
jgi:cytochrome c oxidase subunit 4